MERKYACRVLVGKAEGKTPLGRPKRRWDILKLILIGGRGLDYSG
jgi:hypothetical protein